MLRNSLQRLSPTHQRVCCNILFKSYHQVTGWRDFGCIQSHQAKLTDLTNYLLARKRATQLYHHGWTGWNSYCDNYHYCFQVQTTRFKTAGMILNGTSLLLRSKIVLNAMRHEVFCSQLFLIKQNSTALTESLIPYHIISTKPIKIAQIHNHIHCQLRDRPCLG